MDVDDVLRQSELLLKNNDEEGSGGNKRVLILMSDTGGGHRASAQVRWSCRGVSGRCCAKGFGRVDYACCTGPAAMETPTAECAAPCCGCRFL